MIYLIRLISLHSIKYFLFLFLIKFINELFFIQSATRIIQITDAPLLMHLLSDYTIEIIILISNHPDFIHIKFNTHPYQPIYLPHFISIINHLTSMNPLLIYSVLLFLCLSPSSIYILK